MAEKILNKQKTDFCLQELSLEIVKNICNLKCPNCYLLANDDVSQDRGFMSVEQFKSIVVQAKGCGAESIVLLGGGKKGGEPTLHPEILDFIRIVGENGLSCCLVTNGILLADEEFCKAVCSNKDIYLLIRRNAVLEKHKEMQDRYGGILGYFEKLTSAFNNIEKSVEAGQIDSSRVYLQCTITEEIKESGAIYDVFRYARKNGFSLQIEAERSSTSGKAAPVIHSELFKELYDIDKNEFNRTEPFLKTSNYYQDYCNFCQIGLYIRYNGDALSCGGQDIVHGNINSMKLEDLCLQDSRKLYLNIKDNIVGPCRSCEIYEACVGGCRGESFTALHCIFASDPHCPHTQAMDKKEFLISEDLCSICIVRDQCKG